MSYSVKVIDHYENPRNVGSFGKEDDGVGTGMVGAPACGDVMKLQIKVNKVRRDRGCQVQDLWLRFGDCLVSSLVTEWVKGKTVDQALGSRTPRSPKSWPCRR
jgi:nitrogen fixation NifU-like protein